MQRILCARRVFCPHFFLSRFISSRKDAAESIYAPENRRRAFLINLVASFAFLYKLVAYLSRHEMPPRAQCRLADKKCKCWTAAQGRPMTGGDAHRRNVRTNDPSPTIRSDRVVADPRILTSLRE